MFLRHGKRDHDIWTTRKSWRTANGILKDAWPAQGVLKAPTSLPCSRHTAPWTAQTPEKRQETIAEDWRGFGG